MHRATINGQVITQGAQIDTELPATLVIELPAEWRNGAWCVVDGGDPLGFGRQRQADGTMRVSFNGYGAQRITYASNVDGKSLREEIAFRLSPPNVTPPAVWGNGIIADTGNAAQLFETFGPLGINANRPWIGCDPNSGAITGAAAILRTNDLIKRGWILDPVLAFSNPPYTPTPPELGPLIKTISKSVSGIGCLNEIDHPEYWKFAGASDWEFQRACAFSQSMALKLRSAGFKADSFSLSRIEPGQIADRWARAKTLGCVQFDAIRGHAYDWSYDGNPQSFLLKMERILTEHYTVAQGLGLPLKIDEIGLPPAKMGSGKTMTEAQISHVLPKLIAMLKRYTVAAYFFIATKENKEPHDLFPRLCDDLGARTMTHTGRVYASIQAASVS